MYIEYIFKITELGNFYNVQKTAIFASKILISKKTFWKSALLSQCAVCLYNMELIIFFLLTLELIRKARGRPKITQSL